MKVLKATVVTCSILIIFVLTISTYTASLYRPNKIKQ